MIDGSDQGAGDHRPPIAEIPIAATVAAGSGPVGTMKLATCAVVAVILSGGSAHAEDLQVPFVGCPSDGQIGPEPAPKDDGNAPRLPKALALRLAWYASNNTGGVLGPRGWRCFELEGSNGSVLMVKPDRFGPDPLATQLSGPAIQLSVSLGETSGRFAAAQFAARLFPGRKAFVDSVITEGLEPPSDFVFGPFPTDHITRIGSDMVQFETPAGHDGIGTKSRLVKSQDAIQGLVWMDEDNNATLLAVRLPAGQNDLAAQVIGAMKPSTKNGSAKGPRYGRG